MRNPGAEDMKTAREIVHAAFGEADVRPRCVAAGWINGPHEQTCDRLTAAIEQDRRGVVEERDAYWRDQVEQVTAEQRPELWARLEKLAEDALTMSERIARARALVPVEPKT